MSGLAETLVGEILAAYDDDRSSFDAEFDHFIESGWVERARALLAATGDQ